MRPVKLRKFTDVYNISPLLRCILVFNKSLSNLAILLNVEALFSVVSTDCPERVHVKSWKKSVKRSILCLNHYLEYLYLSRDITRTLVNSKLALTRTKIMISPGFSSYIYCNFTLGNSNLPLTQSNYCCVPSDHFGHIILPSITRTMFWALKTLKSRGKKSVLA